MRTTRDIAFNNRVFTVHDLMRFSTILDHQVSDTHEDFSRYTVTFEDGHKIEGSAVEVFDEEQLNRPCRPIKIEIELYYAAGSIYIRLHSGDSPYSFENSITIRGIDANWVNANYTILHDAVEKVTPQSLWWKQNRVRRFLLFILIALGSGTLEHGLVMGAAIVSSRVWHHFPIFFSLVSFYPAWLWRIALGFPWAFMIRRRLFEMWPSIEFNFGSERLRPRNRQQKLILVLTLVIIPLCVAAIYDLMKEFSK